MMIQPAMKHTLTNLATRMYINGQTSILSENKSYYEHISSIYQKSNEQYASTNDEHKTVPTKSSINIVSISVVNETWC